MMKNQNTIQNKKNRVIAIALPFVMLTLLLGWTIGYTSPAEASAPSNLSVNISEDPLLDVVMTLGTTDSNVSTFADDLKTALVAKGVDLSKIRVQAVDANAVDAGNVDAGWQNYDHYSVGGWPYTSPSTSQSIPNPWGVSATSPFRHIKVNNNGSEIMFYGYESPAYKDFMYMPDASPAKKTFDFTMDDSQIDAHSMKGGGFLFNVNITGTTFAEAVGPFSSLQSTVSTSTLDGQTISAYGLLFVKSGNSSYPALYKVTSQNMATFHGGDSMTLVKAWTNNSLSGVHTIKIEVDGNTFHLWDTVGNVTKEAVYSPATDGDADPNTGGIVDTGSYGFGPVAQYTSHGCPMQSSFKFMDLEMSTTVVREFSAVLREPEWRTGSTRFVINAEDGAVSDFSSPEAMGEILARLGNENVSYVGWGKDTNESEQLSFITKNSGNGTYVNKIQATTDTYAEQVAAMADYIYTRYHAGQVSNAAYLLYGNPNSVATTPSSAQTSTADAQWPDGKWKVIHTASWFANPTSTVPYNNLQMNDLDITFSEPGRYQIYYENDLVKTVYVHRTPEAGFTVSLDGSLNVTITNTATDPDYDAAATDATVIAQTGITSTAYSYKETTSDSWISGVPTQLTANKNYVIRQIVTDALGVESTPYLRYVSTVPSSGGSNAPSTPIAEFGISASTLLSYITTTLGYDDSSYDPKGETISDQLWTVSLNGTEVYSGSTAKTSFSSAAAGTYKLSLKVKNLSGVWSTQTARYMTLVVDSTNPTITSDTSSGTYAAPKVVGLTYADEAGGSGFSHRYISIDSSSSTPSSWVQMGTNQNFDYTLDTEGTWYIHTKAVDRAGNVQVSNLGPFTIGAGPEVDETLIPGAGSITGGTRFNLKFLDGDGVVNYYAVADHSASDPSSWGTATSGDEGGILLNTPGTWYIHTKSNDGNFNRIQTFGPFVVSDPTRTGYTFQGWVPGTGNTANTLPVNPSYGSSGPDAWLATWATIPYQISYDLKNGTNGANNPSGYNIESSEITLDKPTRKGYTFRGWYLNSQMTGSPITSITTGSYGDLTLYAKWTPTLIAVIENAILGEPQTTTGVKVSINSGLKPIVDNLLEAVGLTPSEISRGVSLRLDIQVQPTDDVPEEDKVGIRTFIDKNYELDDLKIGYLDISLFKILEQGEEEVTQTTKPVKISFVLPEEYWGKSFLLIHNHEGDISEVDYIYESKTHTVTFETAKFSTFALAYSEEEFPWILVIGGLALLGGAWYIIGKRRKKKEEEQ